MIKRVSILLILLFYCIYSKTCSISSFDWNPEEYIKNSFEQYTMALWVLQRIPFSTTMHILDIGCGDGRITAEIANKIPNGFIYGIDLSHNMIDFAQKYYADYENIKFFVSSVEDFTINNTFDIVFAFSSLSWVCNIKEALKNIHSLLKKNGLLVALVSHSDCPYVKARKNIMIHDQWKTYFIDYTVPYYSYDEKMMIQLLSEMGYVVECVEKAAIESLFINKQEFIDATRVLPVQIECIPHDKHEDFFEAIWQEYLTLMPIQYDNTVEFPSEMLLIKAKK